MTTSIYDTAWVAMVPKTEEKDYGKVTRWLYPRCFEAIIESQNQDGGFGTHGDTIDQILNTSAALLALCVHQRNPSFPGCEFVPDLENRIQRAKDYLNKIFQLWDVDETGHVGFEILVPRLLEMLRTENSIFDFPGLQRLRSLQNRKLKNFSPSILYGQTTTLLHSLEAFGGDIEFQRLSSHLRHGSMMGSPSSTAAYLIYTSSWDEEAERYLEEVIQAGNGAVPSAFPIITFEITWVRPHSSARDVADSCHRFFPHFSRLASILMPWAKKALSNWRCSCKHNWKIIQVS